MRISKAVLKEVADLRQQGLAVPEIAQEMATSKERVEHALALIAEQAAQQNRPVSPHGHEHRPPRPRRSAENSGATPAAMELQESLRFLAEHDPR
ncbi:hypothetical protein ACFLIM_24665 [Nonomuraea sp. M3C6]|uniref:Uncharacterized protein n=1 Tax=Nonomuraea marmarensis TaxID=3351344 RepID=A0ABW7AH76_9ACTN